VTFILNDFIFKKVYIWNGATETKTTFRLLSISTICIIHTHMMYPSFFLLFYVCILCKVLYYILNLFTDLISCIFLPRQRSDMKFGDHHPADLLSAPSATYP